VGAALILIDGGTSSSTGPSEQHDGPGQRASAGRRAMPALR